MQLLGHQANIQALHRALDQDQVHHAYLFEGPQGVGKRRVAEMFAALVNCHAPQSNQGCGTCRSCQKMMPRDDGSPTPTHPDILVLEPDGNTIKIQQIREMIRLVPFPPIEARFRFVIIDPADRLGTAAANALLKTLEEPPSRTRFILVSSRPDSLPVTVRSRCQRMTFGGLTKADVLKGLRAFRNELPADLEQLAVMADGSLGAAFTLLDDPVMQRRQEILTRFLALSDEDVRPCFEFATDMSELKGSLSTLLDLLRRCLRDALLLVSSEAPRDLTNPDFLAEIQRFGERLGSAGILFRLQLLDDTARDIEGRNLNLKLALERFFLNVGRAAGEETARI